MNATRPATNKSKSAKSTKTGTRKTGSGRTRSTRTGAPTAPNPRKKDPRPKKEPHIEKIGIAGAGCMGRGIAQVFAGAGFAVRLHDRDAASLKAAHERIAADLDRTNPRNGGMTARVLDRIHTASSLKSFKDCDVVIEAITEDEGEKHDFWHGIVSHLKPDAILASTTSSLSITRLASVTGRGGNFIGLHFMNPAPVINLVEVVRGIATEESTVSACRGLVTRIGKTPILSEDFPGFIANRLLVTLINEAAYTLYEGVGSVHSIDTTMRLGATHPMGPLQLADFLGLDTCLHAINVLHRELDDRRYRPCPLLVKYVEAGWLGRKTGRGFYDYSGDKPTPTR